MTHFTKAIFWGLYILAVAIEFTYWAGKVSAPYIKMAVAFTLTCLTYVKEFAITVYNNREVIRETIGTQFVYRYA